MTVLNLADLSVQCPKCNAPRGVNCVELTPGIVHIERRVMQLVEKASPEQLQNLEKALTEDT